MLMSDYRPRAVMADHQRSISVLPEHAAVPETARPLVLRFSKKKLVDMLFKIVKNEFKQLIKPKQFSIRCLWFTHRISMVNHQFVYLTVYL
jgi:hypothetical protein